MIELLALPAVLVGVASLVLGSRRLGRFDPTFRTSADAPIPPGSIWILSRRALETFGAVSWVVLAPVLLVSLLMAGPAGLFVGLGLYALAVLFLGLPMAAVGVGLDVALWVPEAVNRRRRLRSGKVEQAGGSLSLADDGEAGALSPPSSGTRR